MKNKQQNKQGKTGIVIAIAICFFFGYLNIKSGSQNNDTEGYLIAVSGYFAVAIATLASFGLIKRTYFTKS